ncbi:GTP-binding protein HflX [Listeria ivanovii subsp. londoniensis]|uniref:GTPase HflX n=2 Tax=Listeria ivanovii TaxID=1638 RepID=A0ABS1G418_LISIV|nr:GTPase HflX [Listeria ivanovii]AIS59170.1 GTP-binding protein [Listeria ivanovii subsp. londoniensis]MBK1961619.1 GTPase HflX [Listeria ivanovii subsp. londoniensis]MBK2002370.1 GTPase HflX [Listeria ivanovii subsp. londoniensis]MBM5719865.1 GTPase HflX [Listeria ivanovii]SDW42254.1 GTP-binding protein HflX [Listeria ivanovii]
MEKKVLIVGVSQKQKDFDYSMEELANLAAANNMKVVGELRQNMDRENRATYVGKGKVDEVKGLAEMQEAQLIIFNDELSPSQIRNLEETLELDVMDRTGLILAIFANRAKTKEAQLQVEIAKLQYELPRIFGQGEDMDQQSGKGGLSNRGSGEKKIETDRRTIKDQIRHLQKELAVLVDDREVRRRKRKKNEIPVVSLVGYTNAGKSTTMNGLVRAYSETTNKQVFEQDMLFATLETSVREIVLPDNKQFLLTDTVGFVSKLPHQLVKAFRSTLEEARDADLLIHVVDYSDPHYKTMMKTTEETLKAVGVEDVPVIYAYNKADLLEDEIYPKQTDNTIVFSAREQPSLAFLTEIIKKELFASYEKCEYLIPFEAGQIVAYLNDHAKVLETEYLENGTKILAEVSPADLQKLKKYQIEV